jgi:hypothetical protein
MVVFRSVNLRTAAHVLQGILGLHGLGLSVLRSGEIGFSLGAIAFQIGGRAFIVLACANAQEILSLHEPALGWKQSPPIGLLARTCLHGKPPLVWAVAMSLTVAIGIFDLDGNSD